MSGFYQQRDKPAGFETLQSRAFGASLEGTCIVLASNKPMIPIPRLFKKPNFPIVAFNVSVGF
jgi:hypothetical protein